MLKPKSFLMQFKISLFVSLLFVSALSWKNNTNSTNSTEETLVVVNYHNWDLRIRDGNRSAEDFSTDGYVRSNGQFYYGHYDIEWYFNSRFSEQWNNYCLDFNITSSFYLNETANINWVQNCTNYTIYGANTYRVENRTIKSFVTDFVYIPTNSSSNTTNSTNSTEETVLVVNYHNWDLWIRDGNRSAENFSSDGYVLSNGQFFYGQYDIEWYFNSRFSEQWNNYCLDFNIISSFYLNETANIKWVQNCTNYTLYGANTYRVENRLIKSFVTDFVYIPTNTSSSNSSNCTNTTTNSTNGWDIATRQFSAWGRGDLYAILSDYAYDAFVIRHGNNSKTEVIEGYWNIYWVFDQALREMQSCSTFWQTPVVNNNIIYLVWNQECDGRKKVGTNTLVINQFGQIGSLVTSSIEVNHRHIRGSFLE